MKKFFTLIMACALVMSANAVPSLVKADKAETAKRESIRKELKAQIAQNGKTVRAFSNRAKKDVTLNSVAMAVAYYYDGTWEIDMYSADTAFVGSVNYEGGDETHLEAANLEVNDSTNAIVMVNGADTLVSISGSFSIIYDHSAGGYPYYHVVAEELNSEEEAMELDATFPVIMAIDYINYYYAMVYPEYCGTYFDCDYAIDLEDAPFELTGETINVTITDLLWSDHVADQGWWQVYGYNADSTIYITLSNSDEVAAAAGTYTLDVMDMDYTKLYAGTSVEDLTMVKIHDLEFTLTLDEDGNPIITGTLIGKNGVVYILDLHGAPKEIVPSDNVITLAYASGVITVTTTNNDPYFFIMETKASYDKYQSDFTQESVNAETADWISVAVNYGAFSYLVFQGSQTIDLNTFWTTYLSDSDLEAGDYVALAAGVNNDGDMTTDAAYCLFTYVPTAVENVAVEAKAVKRLVNGELMIERNGEMFNVQGIRK